MSLTFLAAVNYTSYRYIAWGVMLLVLVAFLLTAYRDLGRLVLRTSDRGAGLGRGTGLGRVWAVARTAIAESWASGVWAVVPIWFIACVVINLLVDPYEESERLGMYVRVMLFGQEILVLIVMWVLACFSLPKEREKRTIITTGSKPLSRLELFLGKIVGFSTVAAILLLTMGALTYGYLYVQDFALRHRALQAVQAQQSDWERGVPGVMPPSDVAIAAAKRGRMVAENYLTAPTGVQVAGGIIYNAGNDQGPVRFVKGGSEEKLIWTFQPAWTAGQPPTVLFMFPIRPLNGIPLPKTITLNVSVQGRDNPFRGAMMDQTGALHDPQNNGLYVGGLPLQDALWSYTTKDGDTTARPLMVTVRVVTQYAYLQVLEGTDQQQNNVFISGLDSSKIGGDTMRPDGPPRMLGFEKSDMQQVAGPNPHYPGLLEEVASYRFPARLLRKVPVHNGTFTLGLLLDRDFSAGADKTIPTQGEVRAYKSYAGSDPQSMTVQRVTVAEKRMQRVELPGNLLDSQGDLIIDVRTITPDHWIALNDNSARLLEGDSPYFVNLAKSEAVLLLEASLLVTVAVALSVRLGAWVAMLATGMAYILGFAAPFVLDILQLGTYTILAPAEAKELNGLVLSRVYDGFLNVGMNVSYLIARMMPDFRVFDPLKFIVDGRNMPWMVLATDIFFALVFALPFVALGYLLIRKQELA